MTVGNTFIRDSYRRIIYQTDYLAKGQAVRRYARDTISTGLDVGVMNMDIWMFGRRTRHGSRPTHWLQGKPMRHKIMSVPEKHTIIVPQANRTADIHHTSPRRLLQSPSTIQHKVRVQQTATMTDQPIDPNDMERPNVYYGLITPINNRPLVMNLAAHGRQNMFPPGDQVCILLSPRTTEEPFEPWQPIHGTVTSILPLRTTANIKIHEYGEAGWTHRTVAARYDEMLNVSRTPVSETAETIARIAELRSKLLHVDKCHEIDTPKTWMSSDRLKEGPMNADVNEIRTHMLKTVELKKGLQESMIRTNQVITRSMQAEILQTNIHALAASKGVGPNPGKIGDTILHLMQLSDGTNLRSPIYSLPL